MYLKFDCFERTLLAVQLFQRPSLAVASAYTSMCTVKFLIRCKQIYTLIRFKGGIKTIDSMFEHIDVCRTV